MAAAPVDESFKDFIRKLLQTCNLKPEHIDFFTTPVNLHEYARAFTHGSYDPRFNYELYEFQGDVTVNNVIVAYIRKRFPHITSIGYLTRIKHTLVSKKQLAWIASEAGFAKHIRYGPDMEESLRENPDLIRNKDWLSMLEDTVEAFIGCTVELADTKWVIGTGYNIAYCLLANFLDRLKISTRYEDVFDPKSRLKEIFDKMRWPFDAGRPPHKPPIDHYWDPDARTARVRVFGYPLYDRLATIRNRTLLAEVVGKGKDEAEMQACNAAVEVLKTRYGITFPPPPAA